jgi:DNA-binding protein WhiA
MTSTVHRVKEELAHHQASRRCCRLAELSALLHMDGAYTIRGSKGHYLVTESSSVGTARKIHALVHSLFTVETSVVKVNRSTPRRGTVYRVEIPDQPGFHQVLNELGVLDSSLSPETAVPRRLTRNDCCVASALRGAFLGGGYVSEPYGPADMEISFSSREASLGFDELFRRRSLEPGNRARRNQWVLYLKKRQDISTFLAVVGAHSAHLAWESQTILNETKNSVNRLVNCDAANARRLAEASLRQREMVATLRSLGILAVVDRPLRELAEARVQNPQASLSELGRLLEPPVSKAVVQGRLRRLEAMLPSDNRFAPRQHGA